MAATNHADRLNSAIEALSRELMPALEPARPASVSIHDRDGELHWLSAGAFGPDEHNFVLEAMTLFSVETRLSHASENLGDGRSALFLACRTPQSELGGLVFAVIEKRAVDSATIERLVTPQLQGVLQRIALGMRAAAAETARQAKGTLPNRATTVAQKVDADAIEWHSATGTYAAPITAGSRPPARHNGDSAILKLPGGIEPQQLPDISLHVQQLLKLRSGGRTRRFEVLVRARQVDNGESRMSDTLVKALSVRASAAAIDRAVVKELAGWLAKHPQAWRSEPASFSINLSTASLAEPQFMAFVSETLRGADVSAEAIGFEISEPSLLKERASCAPFMKACEEIGCHVVIDDFTMHSDIVPLLASRAVRVVKIDPRLTQGAMRDRLAQAVVIAISQAAKVLGLHCVAKRIDSVATRQWLAAVGVDFAQGFALENPHPIDALLQPPGKKSARPRPDSARE